MSDFRYRDGVLHAEDVALDALAEQVGTPFYSYSSAAIAGQYKAMAEALSGLPVTICYALKANGNLAVVKTLARLGAGADVVSEGEMRVALAAGVAARKIVFAGVGKTRAEMAAALDAGILQFNVESVPELEALSEVAAAKGRRAPVALRVNPDVDARTHAKISTGKSENKFGIDLGHIGEVAQRAQAMPGIALEGLAVHIGSQLTDLAPYGAAFAKLGGLYRDLQASGVPLKRLDFGGGLGIAYRGETPPDLMGYAALVREAVEGLDAELIFEPGRFIVGNAGVLVTRVIYVKQGASRRFVILDAAMNDLIRPAMYDAWHEFVPVKEPAPGAALAPVDIVGPICESSDTFAQQRPLPPVAAGDLLAICSSGAYGAVMSSTYNCRLPAPEVMVQGAAHAVVRARPSYDDLIAGSKLPDWLAAG
jgi:diaminopimelate decarboxylase